MGQDRTPGKVRAHLDRACTLLTAADLDGAAQVLAAAAAELSALGPLPPAARHELRRTVAKADGLLEAVRAYHRDWNHRLGCLLNGYTRDGQPAEVGASWRC